ncbi:MAG TPA: hypothetical protein VGG29_07735 [Caulobacteraceae bacterium]
MQFYRICGLSAASSIELPGLEPTAPVAAPDVVIRQDETPRRLPSPSAEWPTWQVQDDQLLLDVPGIVRFHLIGGREIVFEPAAPAVMADVPIFITHTAFGIALQQRGAIALHASAVAVGGKAVMFLGPSGAGKSTLAAALAQRGHAVIADDLCVLSRDGAGAPSLHGDGAQLQLWAQAIDRLGLAGAQGPPVRPALQKHHMATPLAAAGPWPLAAIYALREARPPHRPGIERPNVVDAAVLVRRSAYRSLLARAPNQKGLYFMAATGAANTPGVFEFTREHDFARIPAGLDALAAHWAQLRVLEPAT